MIFVVSNWPVQSCRVSLIGSFDSTSAQAAAENASDTAATTPIMAVFIRLNIVSSPSYAFLQAVPCGT
jgi:hypothetical protein